MNKAEFMEMMNWAKEQTTNNRLLKESDVLRIAFQLPYVVNSAFADAVKALPSADRWIPCSERLPEVHEVVLVTFEYDGDMLVGITERSQGGFWISENVVAWQPLPQPWKGIDVDCFDSCEYAYSETCDECYKGNKYKRR